MDRKRRAMAAKLLAATQDINTNKHNQLKITKETLISNFVCSCVRLLVHRFTFSMLYDNIRVKMLWMKIFFQILFVWQENDLVFSSEFEKISLKQQYKIAIWPPPPPHTHTHTHIKMQHAMGSINGSHGKDTQIFYKTIKLV